jgi:serine/threonine-protein kinase
VAPRERVTHGNGARGSLRAQPVEDPISAIRAPLTAQRKAETATNEGTASFDRELIEGVTIHASATFPTTEPLNEIRGERYEIESRLGVGGSGEVLAAFDHVMERSVALKRAHAPSARARFRAEVRVTARLEHPNIVPIYDIGTTPEGTPFYAMRRVKNRSLRDVMAKGGEQAWPLRRICAALVDVCRALAYAHSRAIVHGDVKPENVLVGDFGETYLADWELAFVEQSFENAPAMELRGTPGYMAPELVSRRGAADRRIDLFAVGVTLYEVLTGESPFRGGSVYDVFRATVEDNPEPPRARAANVPLVLEELAHALLRKNPSERPTAEEAAQRIDEFLSGEREEQRRRIEALRLCDEAAHWVAIFEREDRAREELEIRARRELATVKPWEPVQRKVAAWEVERAAQGADIEAGLAAARAIELFTQAIGYCREIDAAHRGLARLHWKRARRAERDGRPAEQAHHEASALEHDRGEFAKLLKAPATLVLHSVPRAEVVIERYVESNRRLVAMDAQHLGRTPVRTELPPGSYLITLRADGYAPLRHPVVLRRGETHAGSVQVLRQDEIASGFVHVAGGPAIVGGDSLAVDPLPMHEVCIEDFAIQEFPVTFGEYCEFLDALEAQDPALALRRAPQDLRGSEGMVVARDAEGRWQPIDLLVEGDARQYLREGDLKRLPVCLVSWYDAVAYARWRSERDGVEYRLPTEFEWEKAARGADGRAFPWGNAFDATFCKMRDSRPTVQQPEPVGAFATDVSPYGVCDMAGSIREWMGDIAGGPSAAELLAEPEPSSEIARGDVTMRQVRAGAWNTEPQWTRAASRGGLRALTRGMGLGFRLVQSLAIERRR